MAHSRALILEAPEIVQLSSWMAGFNRDLPTRVLNAISAGRGTVLISSSGPVSAGLQMAVIDCLHAADIVTVRLTAPIGTLAALEAAICEALPLAGSVGQPLVVLIENAHGLTGKELRCLDTLTTLRRTGQKVLHAVLIATPAVLPVLREAGLQGVWDDATAHIRLVSELAACLREAVAPVAPVGQKTWLPPPQLPPISGPRTPRWHITAWHRRRALGTTLGGLILAGYAGAWAFLAPVPAPPSPARTSVTEAETQPLPSLAIAPQLVLKPVFMAAPTRAAKAAPVSSPATGLLPLHVTLFYRNGDPAAAIRAKRLLSQLRREGVLADGPSPRSGFASSLSYVFSQDRAAAVELARQLGFAAPRLSGSGTDALARPGEISIFVGSRDRKDAEAQSKGST